jgi:Tol biopolymer transport system component
MKKTISIVLFLALGLTTEVANADFIWGTPTNLGPTVNSSADDAAPSISADGLQLYFIDWEVFRPGGYGLADIWVTTRETTEDDWGTPVNLGPTVNSSAQDAAMSISADGLSLIIGSNRPGGYGGWDLWVTTRATTEDDWGTPVNLGPTVNSSAHDIMPSISVDGLSLFFTSDRPGGIGNWDIYVTTRATKEDDWGTPLNLGPTVNSTAHDCLPDISADGLALFFSDYLSGPYRPGGFGSSDNWVTTRPTTDDPWGTPVNLGPAVNSQYGDGTPSISADGSTLFFSSRRPGGYGSGDIWQVPIIPVVDFNGDGIIDSTDMCIMVDHWGTDEPLCDIGPMPWGDGIVDVQDLIVLAEHLFEEVPPVELIE